MKKNLILSVVLFICHYMSAQVTIGMLDNPQEGALLEFKENNNNITRNDPNSTKGVLFPKVSLESSTSLSPLYATTAEPQATTSVGMIVYNVNNNASGITAGLCVWNGDGWIALESGGAHGTATFTVNCGSQMAVKGALAKGNSLNPINNTLTLPVNVTKTGKYSIMASTDNGYYYSSSGEFLQAGNYDVLLSGMGSPIKSTTDTQLDTLSFYINGIVADLKSCLGIQTLAVNDISPNFLIIQPVDVSQANLHVNAAGTGLITLRVQATPDAAGAFYSITTDVQSGVQFSATGTLIAGTQTVTLYCNGGIPAEMGSLTFNLTSNSTDTRNGSIIVDVPVTGRTISVLLLSSADNGVWDLAGNYSGVGGGVGLLLNNKALFGPTSNYCRVQGVNVTRLYNTALTDYSGYDVVVVSYAVEPASNAVADALVNYVNGGGALIYCSNNGATSEYLIQQLLGTGITFATTDDRSVKLTGVAGDMIVNNGGYTSSLTGQNFGYDGGGNTSFVNVPAANADILAVTSVTNPGQATILKSKTKTFLAIGDAGPFSGGNPTFADTTIDYHPLRLSADNFPVTRTTASYPEVYNAQFFVNAMIWAINQRLAVAP
jgi:hypothetical protein